MTLPATVLEWAQLLALVVTIAVGIKGLLKGARSLL